MNTNFKVAGTTFHPIPEGAGITITDTYSDGDVPCAVATAILMPEPTNQYDPDAVAVYIRLLDGSAFQLGYVPKTEPLKTKIKKPYMASMVIKDYGYAAGLNPSFLVTEIIGL